MISKGFTKSENPDILISIFHKKNVSVLMFIKIMDLVDLGTVLGNGLYKCYDQS